MERVSITTRRTFIFLIFLVTTRLVISLLCPPHTYIIYNSLWFCMAHYRHLVVYPPCRTITINDRVFWLPFQTSRFFLYIFFFLLKKIQRWIEKGHRIPIALNQKFITLYLYRECCIKAIHHFFFKRGKKEDREREREKRKWAMNERRNISGR